MKLRTLLSTLFLGLGVFSAQASEPVIIKVSHVVAPNTPKGKAAEYFKRLGEERTTGQVKVEVYPNSQLYKDREEMEALQFGAVQMLAPSLSKFGPLGMRQFELFDLPCLFPNKETSTGSWTATLASGSSPCSTPRGSSVWPSGTTVSSR